MRSFSVGFAGLVLFSSGAIGAQERAVPPADVAVVADGASAVVTWTPVEGVMYRVARTLDPRRAPVDITAEPIGEAKVYDPKIQAGVTYFYQVIAVYRDATTASAPFVSFTAPSAIAVSSPVLTQPLSPITEVAPVRTAMPTEVSGVTVVGNTTASALVSWQPVAGATSYSIKRSYSSLGTDYVNSSQIAVTGLTTTSWNDLGPVGIGFPIKSLYIYDVTATLPFGTVSGQGSWKRPDPTCAEVPANQPTLTILDPTKLASIGVPVVPAGATITWQNGWTRNGAIALRIDRSEQGSGTWTPVGSSCDGKVPVGIKSLANFVDEVKGVSANTTYLYRLTSFAANGEIGSGTLAWTSPNRGIINWLSATSSGSTVTLKIRYEPPAANAPTPPDRFRVTSEYGLNQPMGLGTNCTSLIGCSLVLTGVPSGTHTFTAFGESKLVSATSVSYLASHHTPKIVVVQ